MELIVPFASLVVTFVVSASLMVTVYLSITPRRYSSGMELQVTLMLVELWFAAASITGGWLGTG